MIENNILELIEKKDYSAAKSLLENVLKNTPDDIEVHKLLGLCNINLNNYDEALKNFDFVIENNKDDALSIYYTANIYIEKNDLKKAENLLNNVIKLRNEYIDAYKALALIYLKTKRYDKVFELCNKFIEEGCNDAQIYDILAAASIENAGFDLAVEYLKKAVEIEPNNPKYISKLGIAYFAMGNITYAIDSYNKALEYSPDDKEILYNLGLSYYSLEDYKSAYDYLKKAYEKGMENCLNALALCAYKAQYFKEGIEYYSKLSELYPDKDNYQYNLACCYDGIKDFSMATKIIERLLTFNLTSLQLKLHLASLYSRQGRLEAAKVLYADILSIGYMDKNIMYEYAVLCAQTNETDKAEEILNEIIKMDPNYAIAYKDLAIIYTTRKLFDRAEYYFEKATKADPNNIYVLFEMANYYHVMAEFDKAKKVYAKLLKQPNVPSFMNLAVAKNYMSMNMHKQARKILFKLFQEDPSNVDVLFYLGQVLAGEKNYDVARELLETAYTIFPGAEIANILAKVYMELGLYDKAYNLYKIISTSAPNSVTLMLAMAECKLRQKDYAKALEHISPVIDMFPEHEEALEILDRIKNEK